MFSYITLIYLYQQSYKINFVSKKGFMKAKMPRVHKNPNVALRAGQGAEGGVMLPIVHRTVKSREFTKGDTDNMAPRSSGRII